MADEPLPSYTPYTENVHISTFADPMDEDSDDDGPEPEYPTLLSPPPPYHAALQRDPPNYNVAIPTVQSERRHELQRQWTSYAEGKRFEHRRNYVSWKRARSTTHSNSASDISSVTLAGTPSSSPSSPVPTVPTAPIMSASPPPPPPATATPLTTRQRAKRALVQFPAKLGCFLAKVIMLDKMASWAAKTRHWKKTKRDYVKEVSGERNLFVGAAKRVSNDRPALSSVSPRPATRAVRVVPLRADSVMSVAVPNEAVGPVSEQDGGIQGHENGLPVSSPGTAAGTVRPGSSLLKRVGSLSQGKKKNEGDKDFPIPQLGRRPSKRRPGDNPGLAGTDESIVA